MIRMIEEDDILTCWWWYNWYITHSTCTFETVPIDGNEFTERVHRVRRRYPWIVLQENKELLGYAYLDVFNERAAYDHTADVSIYLNPQETGKGYGKRLMKALEDIAVKDGYYSLISIITETNTSSMHLHESFGFKKAGFLEKSGYKDGKWLGVAYYQKNLVEADDDRAPQPLQNLDPYLENKHNRVPENF